MEIVKLPTGNAPPIDSDCIRIETGPGGFRLTGSVLADGESRAIVDGALYDSHDAAEAAGLSWAGECGVAKLYVASEASDSG